MGLFSRLHGREISITGRVISGKFLPEEAIMNSPDNRNGIVHLLGAPPPSFSPVVIRCG